jgi:hypothetical protein
VPVSDLTSWLPLGLLAFGVLFVIHGYATWTRDRRRRASWLPYPGRVVATRLDDGQFHSRIAYLRDGHELTFWNRFTSTALTDPVGREVDVLVNPDDPDDAAVSAGLAGGGTVGIVLMAFGVLAALVGGYLLS